MNKGIKVKSKELWKDLGKDSNGTRESNYRR